MITKLADRWRKWHYKKTFGNGAPMEKCADELTAALPDWTRITDDKSTWPERCFRVMFSFGTGGHSWITFMQKTPQEDGLLTAYWRPLCDLDYPPEEN